MEPTTGNTNHNRVLLLNNLLEGVPNNNRDNIVAQCVELCTALNCFNLTSLPIKQCTKCHKIKPINEFYTTTKTKTGVSSQCCVCFRTHVNTMREHKRLNCIKKVLEERKKT